MDAKNTGRLCRSTEAGTSKHHGMSVCICESVRCCSSNDQSFILHPSSPILCLCVFVCVCVCVCVCCPSLYIFSPSSSSIQLNPSHRRKRWQRRLSHIHMRSSYSRSALSHGRCLQRCVSQVGQAQRVDGGMPFCKQISYFSLSLSLSLQCLELYRFV